MKVLIVDDSNFSQKITAKMLEDNLSPLDSYFAADGQQGFQTYKEIHPDYVFADLLMPGLNGEEMIKLIKAYDPDAKIIVLTADVQKRIKADLEEYKILSFVNKPFTPEKAALICQMMKEYQTK